MKAFVFIGNDDESPDVIEAFGYTFERNGAPVVVSGEFALAKLSANKEFQEVIDGRCEEVLSVDVVPAEDEKSQLIARLESLGVKVDRRKSVESLKAMIAEAQDADGG